MILSYRTRMNLMTTLGLVLGWVVAFVIVVFFLRRFPFSIVQELIVVFSGVVAGILSAWFELRFIPAYARSMSAGRMLLSRTLFYVIMLTVLINTLFFGLFGALGEDGLFGIYTSERYRLAWTDGRMLLGIASLTLVSFLINFIRQVNRMLGAGTLINLLLGRYLSPVEEERIFMFMDLNNSTTIAEKLGPRRFNEFKNDFFYDVSEPIQRTRGRIYQYVGDEVVVTWTMRQGLLQGNCVRCFFLITEQIHTMIDYYLQQYGMVPEFKAGFHGGTVVTSEIGYIKKDIVHSGDTVNTAARIEAQCRPLDRQILVSETLLEQCQVPDDLQVEDMGEQPLRGKEHAVRLYSVTART